MIDAESRDVGIKIRSSLFVAKKNSYFSKSVCNIGKRLELIYWDSDLNRIKKKKQGKISQKPLVIRNCVLYEENIL